VKFDKFIEHIHPARIPAERIRISATFCLGGVSFFLFITLGVTGLLLTVYYLPSPEGARAGLHDLTYVVPFGWLIRSLHFWAGQLLIVTILLHTLRVVSARAYLPPRQTNWLIGVALLLTTFGLDFSGYVLLWDAQTFWAAQVMSHLVGLVPLVGPELQQILLGGPELNASGLLRFYAFHCFFGPVLCLILIMYHFWRVRRDGKLGQPL
jgi:quinol-cytochrome oxidoreductase complex cytochrome b subunit